MLLAIDAGNTNTVFALFRGDDWLGQWRVSTSTARTADEYAAWLHQVMQIDGLSIAGVEDCIISSVVPQSLFHFRNLARRYIKVEPLVINDKLDFGVEIRIERPSEAGADRLVNTVGAHKAYGGPLIVVDSGTAINFDIVSADGAFEGGIIAPGINLSMQALHDAAAMLPRIAIERPDQVIGKATVSAMRSGVYWGYVDMIQGLLRRVKEEYGQKMSVVATGGVASLFEGAIDEVDHFDPHLTIRGLHEIHRRVRGAHSDERNA